MLNWGQTAAFDADEVSGSATQAWSRAAAGTADVTGGRDAPSPAFECATKTGAGTCTVLGHQPDLKKFDADGNGGGAAVPLATLSTRPVIGAADIVLGS